MQPSWTRALLFLALIAAVAAAGAAPHTASAQEPLIVLDVRIVGNEHVPTETIRGAMTETRIGEPLDFDATNADLISIYNLGYFYDVVPHLEEVPGARTGVRLVIEVFEYPVIRRLDIASEGVPADAVRDWMTTREGRILNVRDFENDLMTVQELAVQEYDVFVRPVFVDLNEEAGVLTLQFRAARVGEIVIEGHEKTRDYVLEREITFKEGDILNREQVRRSVQRLTMLGYFQSVNAEFFETDDPDALGVRFVVEERKTGLASFGAGYSTQDGFIGYIEVADENFLGRGQRANLRWEFGKTRNTYDLGFYEPYFLGTTTSIGFNLYNATRTYSDTDYSVHRVGGDVTLGRPLGEFTRGFLRFKMENWDDSLAGTSVDKGSTRSLTLSTRTDTTNHPFYPTEGFRNRLSVERAGGWLGGTTEFTKFEADVSTYIKIGQRDRQALALRAMLGTGSGAGGGLPRPERFRLGGSETLRGYNFGEFEGDRMLVLNAEFRFPIVDAVEGVVFADFGRTFSAGEGISFSDLKAGYGVGIRLDTPLGILRIDYGIGESGGRTYFSFGPMF